MFVELNWGPLLNLKLLDPLEQMMMVVYDYEFMAHCLND